MAVASAAGRDQETTAGLSGSSFQFIDVVLVSGSRMSLALKIAAPSQKGAMMGLAREAFFYTELAPQLELAGVPKCYHSVGDMLTGETTMLVENIADAVPAGVFFGAGNPNNWAIKDKLEDMCKGNPSAEDITRQSFSLYAALHSTYWQSEELLSKAWLRGADWYQAQGEASWIGAQKMASDGWAACSAQRDAGASQIS